MYGPSGQPLGQLVTEQRGGTRTSAKEGVGINRIPTFGSPHRHPKPVVTAVGLCTYLASQFRQETATPGHRQSVAEELAVHGVTETHLRLLPDRRRRAQQADSLQVLKHAGLSPPGHDADANRLRQGHGLEQAPLRFGHAVEAGTDD